MNKTVDENIFFDIIELLLLFRRCHMQENSKIHFIPAIPKREKRVAVYAWAIINDSEQLKSITAQLSAFTRLVASTPVWLLVDI